MGVSGRIADHVIKLKLSQTGLFNMAVSLLVLKWPPKSPALNPIEHLWYLLEQEGCIMDVKLTYLQ